MKVKVGIIGATGYAGKELIRLLLRHPGIEIVSLSAKLPGNTSSISPIFPEFKGIIDLPCINFEEAASIAKIVDLVFLALPHTVSMKIVPEFLESGKKVIDLSADFRLHDAAIYEQWYNVQHSCPKAINEAVYGLPELYREEIKKAGLIANPGCYPTSVILGIVPLLKEGLVDTNHIIVNSVSGVSGVGREPSLKAHFPERNESFAAYSVGSHRHIPEIEQELGKLGRQEVKITFVTHLAPMDRGILSTIYLQLKKEIDLKNLLSLYNEFYSSCPFVRIREEFPETKWVTTTNYCDISLKEDKRTGQVIVLSSLDNLIKGASGQAVQNMNLMYGFEETLGIR
ncbi:MAG: N-acetyl-gamma-glutamyl-phosphate reductase [bacterium]|nr:N-acetyl-gamma-glutamyl-phosphate reductase [bacterium]